MYAKFCKSMLESMSPEIKDENIRDRNGTVVAGGSLFRKYLLNRCQEEFERGWKTNLPAKPEGTTEEVCRSTHEVDVPSCTNNRSQIAMMSDEYYIAAAAKRRGLGLVKFIGELYKLGMLTERIMHECVKKLVDYEGVPDEAEVESLTSLLRTIGASLDASEKGPAMMDAYFARIHMMMETPNLPSRLRFMLLVSFSLTLGLVKGEQRTNIPSRILLICVPHAGTRRMPIRVLKPSLRFARL
jgi:translation initiation factor 4G